MRSTMRPNMHSTSKRYGGCGSATCHLHPIDPEQSTQEPLHGRPRDVYRFQSRVFPACTLKELPRSQDWRHLSRTQPHAHGHACSASQAVSADNHPVHYDVEWACRHGHTAPVVHGLQVLAFTAPGATLFPHYIGETFISFTEVSCRFLQEVHSGDTLYPALEIIALDELDEKGLVTTAVSVFNQRGEMVLSGQHKYTLKLR